MFVWLWCGCLCEIEWNLKLFESWMSGNKRTFLKLSSLHFDLHEFKSILSQNPRVKMIWLLPFKINDKGFFKIFEFHLEIFQIQKLYATQWLSWEKIKWLLQIIRNIGWKLKESNWKSFGSILKPTFNLGVICLFSNYFSPKTK